MLISPVAPKIGGEAFPKSGDPLCAEAEQVIAGKQMQRTANLTRTIINSFSPLRPTSEIGYINRSQFEQLFGSRLDPGRKFLQASNW